MDENNFYSIDRLVEFGMGVAVAQQMVKTINHAIEGMQVPGVMNPMHRSHPQIYYAMLEGQQAGPFSEGDLSKLLQERKIVNETYIWKPGMIKWDLAQNLPDVLRIVALSPPPFNNKG